MYKLPTPHTIHTLLPVLMGDARIIRAIMEKYLDGEYESLIYAHPSHGQADCLRDINKILNGHGVEGCTQDGNNDDYLDSDKWTAQYVNMGDTYNATVIFLSGGHPKFKEGFKLMCYGDLYE